ncbi:phosphoglycerate dehydrogenase [Pseudoroseomonas wenyumeiae]|uniref:D-3-phosphoglycerate dehydrogenase n=1 Tax=Teichococcus wenyumeiae TaxID=2478470 RepID=A0A3A9JB68_9PROT|nr:phosphoglycerate dehydrogenase [Pseudoroseomonas wenyumeiae]RKK01815.1 phosphoglycerate dehydrogenase [Pseudoroseomonas wenyumeiae]RMI24586.1 phosphoglycerate dehydrogenase [Pseudoroseomonas wenyumeiae]
MPNHTAPSPVVPLSNQRISLPKERIRILLLEGVSDTAVSLLAGAGYTNVQRETKALEGEALTEALQGVHLLGIRSRTQLTVEALRAADRLIAVGCFCIGTNQVDLAVAKELGIPVFNAPFSNTRSVAELTMGEIVMLLRRIPDRSRSAHDGGWDKSADNSKEVRGKTLGIVGYGNIGSQLSVLAEAFGMRVIYYDTIPKLGHGNAVAAASLHDLLAASDVVTLHVPETDQTTHLIGPAEIAAMRPGALLINNSRGKVVDLDALAEALKSGHLLGAAADVFPEEPKRNGERFTTPLQGLPNVILTPHIGGSTEEAQERIGEETARKLSDYSDTGATLGAVNFPEVTLPATARGTRFLHVHRNVPGVLAALNEAFSRYSLNITAQYLQTDPQIGYVVVDAENVAEPDSLLATLRDVPGTIRARLIYERH